MTKTDDRLTIRVIIPAGLRPEISLPVRAPRIIDVQVSFDDAALAHARLVQKALAEQTDRTFIRTLPRLGKMHVALWPVSAAQESTVPFLAAGWLSKVNQMSILLTQDFGFTSALLGTQAVSLALSSNRSHTDPGPSLKTLLGILSSVPQLRDREARLRSVSISLTDKSFDGLMLG